MRSAILAVLVVSAVGHASAATPIFSESFDGYGVPNGSFSSFSPGPNRFGGWFVGDSGVDIVSTNYGGGAWPANGAASLDLNGPDVGSISRVLTGLTPSSLYRMTFRFASNQDGAPGFPTSFRATAGNVQQVFGSSSYSVLSTGTLDFVPLTSSAFVQFSSLTAGSGRGAILDDITVTMVPEPHEWAMMLAGLGLVGWASRRRGVSSQAASAT